MVPEAPMEDGPDGRKTAGDGWFIVNARETPWIHNEKFGAGVVFEGSQQFPHYCINVQVVWPGQPNCYYHAEEGQEDFLVVSGECLVLIEGQERRLRAWDFVHCPPFTEHVFVGAGDGPCVFVGSAPATAARGWSTRSRSSRCATRRASARRRPPARWRTRMSPRRRRARPPRDCWATADP
jgi:uncharacterized cupin superfamily protein